MTRRRILAAAAVVAVALLPVIARVGDDGADGPDRGRVVEPDPGFTIGSRGEPYRIVYRLDDLSHEEVRPSTDEVWVRQPFESRLESSSGEPPGGEVQSVQVAAVDRLRLPSEDEHPLVIARVPGLAVSDVRVAPVLDDAVDAGLLELREQRIVAGRRCQVVRSGSLLGGGRLVPITAAEHADTCLDAEGLLLEETLSSGGEPGLHRIAVEVDTEPPMTSGLFDAGDIVVPVAEGGSSARPVDPEAGAVGSFWVLPGNEPPDGFEGAGRFSIIPPQPQLVAAGGRDPAIVAGTADVFVRGGELVVVYQGGTLGGVVAFPPTEGAPHVDGGAIGDGEALLSAIGTELRFPQPHGHFVHVVGSLPADDLRAIARSLTETQGTGLVYLDG